MVTMQPAPGRGPAGEGSSRPVGEGISSTLREVMRAPSTTLPPVVDINEMPPRTGHTETLDPKEDLWLSTSDG